MLLARDGITTKIGDVGFSRITRDGTHASSLSGRLGTFNFCAPEVLLGGRASLASDVYSFGLLLHAICAGRSVTQSVPCGASICLSVQGGP